MSRFGASSRPCLYCGSVGSRRGQIEMDIHLAFGVTLLLFWYLSSVSLLIVNGVLCRFLFKLCENVVEYAVSRGSA